MADLAAPSVRALADLEDYARLERIRRGWLAYDGKAPKPLAVKPGNVDDNVRLAFAQPTVDKGAFYLFGKGGGVRPQLDERQLTALHDAWPSRQLDHLKAAINGGVSGHAWLRLHASGRVVVLDTANVTAHLADDDIDTATHWTIQWTVPTQAGAKARRQRILPAGAQWEIVDEESEGSSDWRTLTVEAWPHDWPPILGCQNRPAPNEHYGRADLEPQVLDLIANIEQVVSNANRVARLLGHPIPFATGQQAHTIAQIDSSIGNFLTLPDAEVHVGMLEMRGELGTHIALYERLREALREVSMLPEVTSGKLENAGSLSGVALSILYGPLIELTETKRLCYGPFVSTADRRVLELVTGGDPGPVMEVWSEVAPEDPAAEVMALEADQRMGIVSRETLAGKRGYIWAEEAEGLREDAEESARRFDRGQVGVDPDDDDD